MSPPSHRLPGAARRRRALVVLGAVAAAVALAVDTPAGPFADPPSGLSVGPEVVLPMNARVFVMPAAGGRVRRVTPRDVLGFDPEWNPRTGTLATVTEQGIHELGLSRSGPAKGQPVWEKRVLLTSTMGWSPSFSPNGSELALVTGGRPDVWVLTRATGSVRQLTSGWDAEGFVDWSLSGDAIAAIRFGQIFVLRPSGAIVRAITAEDEICAVPAWSPDGRSLAFTQIFPQPRVVISDPFGSVVRTIGGATPAAYAAWSPDGKRIAFAKYVDRSWDLFVRNLRSGSERRLTRTPYDEVDPVWSPNGRWLASTADERSDPAPQ